MRRSLPMILVGLLLSACAAPPTISPGADSPTTTATLSASETRPAQAQYRDNQLCLAVEVEADWKTDGAPGGFASFTVGTGQVAFQIVNVDLGPAPDLDRALAEVQRGTLSSHLQSVQSDFTVDGQPARLVTFAPGADYSLVALVIAPDCGDGPHALFISAKGADQKGFEAFLNHIHLGQDATRSPN
jgi:hypothetical protein